MSCTCARSTAYSQFALLLMPLTIFLHFEILLEDGPSLKCNTLNQLILEYTKQVEIRGDKLLRNYDIIARILTETILKT